MRPEIRKLAEHAVLGADCLQVAGDAVGAGLACQQPVLHEGVVGHLRRNEHRTDQVGLHLGVDVAAGQRQFAVQDGGLQRIASVAVAGQAGDDEAGDEDADDDTDQAISQPVTCDWHRCGSVSGQASRWMMAVNPRQKRNARWYGGNLVTTCYRFVGALIMHRGTPPDGRPDNAVFRSLRVEPNIPPSLRAQRSNLPRVWGELSEGIASLRSQ